MAGFGWNQNISGFSHGRPIHCSRTVIACRLCDKLFLSTQALINHVAFHIPDEDGEDGSHSYYQSGLISNNHFRSSPSMPTPAIEAGQMMFLQNRFRQPVEPAQQQMTPSKLSREEASTDLTKPYINQLEKRIPIFPGFENKEEEKKWEQKTGKLDLSLRL